MSIERVFLGWDGPCLPRAAGWLSEHHAGDWSRILPVTPTGRAARRLAQLLEERTSGAAAGVKIITFGELPEFLFAPAGKTADALRSLLCRADVLRRADPALLGRVIAKPPGEEELDGWLALAHELQHMHESLAAEGLRVGDVAGRCEARSPDFAGHDRWAALTDLQGAYERALAAQGLTDRHAARLAALDGGQVGSRFDIVLISTVDLPAVTRRLLAQLAGRVMHLIHTPESESPHFDDWGCPHVEHWATRRIDIDDRRLRFVDRPRDQAHAIIRAIGGPGEPASLGGKLRADQITLGLGDRTLAPLVRRTLDLAGLPAEAVTDAPVRESPPARLLEALGQYLRSRRLSDFCALLRHPDLEAWLDASAGVQGWLTLLDRYATDHLQGRLTGEWLGGQAESLKALHDAVLSLLPDADKTRPLPAWSAALAEALRRVYAGRSLDRANIEDRPLIAALISLGNALRQQGELNPKSSATPRVTATDAITLTLSRLVDAPQEEPDSGGSGDSGGAIRLLPWLDLQLDDAPALIVTGFNDGCIPERSGAEPFLSEPVRRALGLMTDQRRLARDAMMLTAILHSRPHVLLIAGRRGDDDDPLVPSRLLLACDPRKLPERVESFVQSSSAEAQPLQLMESGTNGFVLPAPTPPEPAINTLRVTAFRAYLDCPYRFYLSHVLKLEDINDRTGEMDEAHFGSLAHAVLERFGKSDLAATTVAKDIRAFLWHEIDTLAEDRFGSHRASAVVIQAEQLRQRLAAFAVWQAQQAAEGWRILQQHVETRFTATLDIGVPGRPFTITGQIDRIDQHPELGYRLLDYKTSDSGPKPEKVHREGRLGEKKWIDLQLPLYQLLVQAAGMSGPMTLGYIQLPKDLAAVGLAAAEWTDDELAGAHARACEVARKVYDGIFWPPTYPPRYFRELADLCQDENLDRAPALATGNAWMKSWRPRT